MPDPTTENKDWTNHPTYLRQIAAKLDGDRKTPCAEAMICREAASEIEALRLERNPLELTKALVRENLKLLWVWQTCRDALIAVRSEVVLHGQLADLVDKAIDQ